MPVLALGVSYRRAPVELLERLSIAPDEESKAYRRLVDLEAVGEAVLLSTCNRVEIYAEVDRYHTGFQDLKRFLAEASDVGTEELAEPMYAHYEDQATEHLFAVAAGLDSMVLGEPQILSQVRAAYKRAREEGSAGAELAPLFERAVRTGRRVRGETGIGARPAEMIEAGLALAREHLGSLDGRSGLVLGAGEMGALAARALRRAGVDSLTVLGRRPARAERLASRHHAAHGSLEDLAGVLPRIDVVVSSTAAPSVVVPREAVEAAGRPMFLLDLAVPRDVDPAAGLVDGARIADIDDLRPVVAERSGSLEDEASSARSIVEQEVDRYRSARRARRLSPVIQALRDHGERVRAEELERMAARMASLPPREREAVEALTRRIVARLLHEPTVRLKDAAAAGRDEGHASTLAELFGLEFEP